VQRNPSGPSLVCTFSCSLMYKTTMFNVVVRYIVMHSCSGACVYVCTWRRSIMLKIAVVTVLLRRLTINVPNRSFGISLLLKEEEPKWALGESECWTCVHQTTQEQNIAARSGYCNIISVKLS